MSEHTPYKLEEMGTTSLPVFKVYDADEVPIGEFENKEAARLYYEGLRTGWVQACNNYEAIKEAGGDAIKALEAVEWKALTRMEEDCCPSCWQTKDKGHKKDCIVGNTLANWKAVSGE